MLNYQFLLYVLNSLCKNKDNGVCSAVFGHVLGTVGDDVCAAALTSGWVLFEASWRGQLDVVRRLCGMDCVDINRPVVGSGDSQTALWIASRFGEYGVVEVLLGAGADVSIGDVNGSTPLHEAADSGHIDIVELLLESGAEVDARRSSDGATPLCDACQAGWLDVARLLVAWKADVNAARTDGATPLLTACQIGHLSVVEWLLGRGADVNAANKQESTPLEMALLGTLKDVDAVNAKFYYPHLLMGDNLVY